MTPAARAGLVLLVLLVLAFLFAPAEPDLPNSDRPASTSTVRS